MPEPRNLLEISFDEWWQSEGRFIDPDTTDVPWFDKRRELCWHAYQAGRKFIGGDGL